MSGLSGAVDHFYEVIPGRWILIGWSSLSDLNEVVLVTSKQQTVTVSVCPVRLLRLDVAQAFNDEHLNQAGFVAFLTGDGCSSVQSVVIGGDSVGCHPLPLPSKGSPWSCRLHDLLNVLQVQHLSATDLKLLLLSGLFDLVVDGARDWNSSKPWKDYRFESRHFGCRHGQFEMTLVLVATPNHQPLLDQLERLCWDTWCIGGRVHVLLICDQGDYTEHLSEALQAMLCLEQISMSLILPEHQLGLIESLNLGVYLSQTDTVILDPACLIDNLYAFIHSLRGPALLEPGSLLVPKLNGDYGQVSSPIWFRRDCFFELGALQQIGLGEKLAIEYLCRSFEMGDEHDVRRIDDLPINALRAPSQEDSFSDQLSYYPSWQDAVMSSLAVF